ncbi:MAG: enoyl-CoA hydratase/isomerase family protein [Gammaproteobacteria bacterium]|jgi:enoyl-CoA hydratase/carnithine racemase|nr:enoyl-CoA hydratase/isomerase family protein [Gammaproteobacteria bacterium]HJP03701.1 enoyl-CoA hydratase/isomerase family protein [Gammaproteobacteria bacterium]
MLDVKEHENVIEISMQRPPVNAMNQEFVDAIADSINHYVREGADALILSGREGLFSAGIDVPELLELDHDDVNEFWTRFFVLMNTVAGCQVPVVAAITGHSPAGGAVLALHCDYRVATRGKFNIGMNEVQVGLPVPRNLIAALEYVVGNRQAALLSSSGALIRPDKALEIGLVDELADPGEVVTCALGWLKEMLALPPIAMNKTRLAAKSALLERAAENTAYARVATDYWFSDETQTTMKQLVASLSKKS